MPFSLQASSTKYSTTSFNIACSDYCLADTKHYVNTDMILCDFSSQIDFCFAPMSTFKLTILSHVTKCLDASVQKWRCAAVSDSFCLNMTDSGKIFTAYNLTQC